MGAAEDRESVALSLCSSCPLEEGREESSEGDYQNQGLGKRIMSKIGRLEVVVHSLLAPMARRRHLARIVVMQVLFERDRHGGIDVFKALTHNLVEYPDVDQDFSKRLLSGIVEREEDLQCMVMDHAPDWPLERMDPISRVLLLMGAYELLFGGDAPPAVVMNEAIEIAKEYGTEESGKFVNGVLNAIAHRGAQG